MDLGRIVRPSQAQSSADTSERPPVFGQIIESILNDPALRHTYFDISWDELAKYAITTPEVTKRTTQVINSYPDRFLFRTGNVASPDQAAQLRVLDLWGPVWRLFQFELSQMRPTECLPW